MPQGALRVAAPDGTTTALLVLLPPRQGPEPEASPESGFARSVRRWHYLGIAGGALLAVILAL